MVVARSRGYITCLPCVSSRLAGSLEVAALLDPVASHAALLRQAFPRARMAHQLSDLPWHEFDLAIVASPHALHAAQTIQLLAAGVSVLCEKPMATSVDDARAMIQAASAARGLLAIGLVRRFFPASRMIRHMLALGALGDITSFEFSEGSASFGWPAASRGYFSKREAQGGVLMDIGVHALDLLQWWLGKTEVLEYADDAMGGIEANSLIRCRLECGAVGVVRLSRDCALESRYTVRGSRGWLSWQAGQVDHFELGFADSRQVIQAGSATSRPRVSSRRSSASCKTSLLRCAEQKSCGCRPRKESQASNWSKIATANVRSWRCPGSRNSEIARARELNGGQVAGGVAR